MFKEIIQPFNYTFSVSQKGLYAISVSASCKSGKLLGLFGGEDLRVEIDNLKLREAPAKDKPQYKDIPSTWNGTELKGLSKTVVFILWLEQGEHTIKFIPDRGAIIEKEPEIVLLDEKKKEIELLTDLQAEDGDCRPWITIALIDLPLKSFSCEATVKWRKFDGDDIKIIIDNKIKKNKLSILHRNWIFSANIFKNFFQKEKQSKTFQENLKKGIHYIEFWADQMPILHKVNLEIGKIEPPTPKLSKAKIVWQKINLRKEPNTSSEILANLKKDEIVEILEKAIKGERPKNQKGEYLFSDRWHKAQYKKQIGYIYSEALEIEGEDKETIKKLIFQKAKELKEDECLMLAVAKRESKFFPYAMSSANANGIFQLKNIAVSHVNKEFRKNFSDPFDINQNIEAGILYFQIVQKKYQGKDHFREKCLAGWNRGMNKVQADELFIIEDQPAETQQFIYDVFKFWEDCKNSGKVLLFILLLTSIFFVVTLSMFFLKKPFPIPSDYAIFSILAEEKIDIDKDSKDEKIVIISNIPTEFTFGITKILLIEKDGSFLELPNDGGEMQWFKIGDFNKNGKIELAVMYDNYGSAGFKSFYLYEWQGQNFKTLLSTEEINSKIEFKDLDKDEISEIFHKFNLDKWCCFWTEIYKWDKEREEYVKANNLFSEIYQKWLEDYQSQSFEEYGVGIPSPEYFESQEWKEQERINNCLKEKAQLNSQGVFSDGRDCIKI